MAWKPNTIIDESKVNGYSDSAHSGTRLKSKKIPPSVWNSNNEGYVYGSYNLKKVANHQLALQFIKEKKFITETDYSHGDDCYYKKNWCHIEERGGHRFLRPSNCSKFVLKSGKKYFNKYNFQYAYHGTAVTNVGSIYQHGLRPSGTGLPNGQRVHKQNGNVFGNGVYTTKIPLYAQLYATPCRWKGKWVQTIWLVRQDPKTVLELGSEGKATKAVLRRDDFDVLYGGLLNKNEIQFLAKGNDYKSIVLQALLVKIHDVEPRSGEYKEVLKVWQAMK
eukprot:157455_1